MSSLKNKGTFRRDLVRRQAGFREATSSNFKVSASVVAAVLSSSRQSPSLLEFPPRVLGISPKHLEALTTRRGYMAVVRRGLRRFGHFFRHTKNPVANADKFIRTLGSNRTACRKRMAMDGVIRR
jgi:hypothetical protein